MAYTVLLSLSRTIRRILNPYHKFPISDIGKQQIESLNEPVIFLHEFLVTYPGGAKDSETDIATAANEAEDILEHFMYEHIQWHHKSVQTTTDLYDFRELKTATEEIESLAAEAWKSRAAYEPVRFRTAILPPTFDHTLPEDFTVGLEEDMEKLVHLVCNGYSDPEIIAITGMCGIGKTTLARNVYNHARVKQTFDIRVWVTMSRDDEITILADPPESLKEIYSSDEAPDKIYKGLSARKYLIVVDDLWSTEAWHYIKRMFPRGTKGSRLVITTREKDLASYASSSLDSSHEMKLLDVENSWILFERKVFKDKKCPIELKEIGQDICNSSWGIPLTIVVVAGFLSNAQHNRRSWEEIAKDLCAAVNELPTLDHTLPEDFTVGLENETKKITDLVCEGSSHREIITITGMGGIGKTTLARNAYNHPRVKQKFAIRAWLTVTRDCKIDNIISCLLESLKEVGPNIYYTSDIATDREKIFLILSRRRYLIVLDDVWWTTNVLIEMIRIFPDNGRVLITTRLRDVATHASGSDGFHEMCLLDENQSWILLESKVFRNKNCPPALQKIAKDIAKVCGGLPLAIVVIAKYLCSISSTPPAWEEFAKNARFILQKDEQFDKIMSLSYNHLPHHLRTCFLYMGGFPKDYEIQASKLIKLWIAEGFIAREPGKSCEEVAEECLEDLVRVSLALVSKKKSNGRVKICNVHDLIRDMSRRKAEDENLERRLNIGHPDLRCVAKVYGSTIRSVTCFQPSDTSLKTLRKLHLLRVLDVVDAAVYSLPDQVFDLFHLRYLTFGCPMEVPTAISRLQNLRTLIIHPSKRFRNDHSMDEAYLPIEIWSLSKLRHLISFCDLLPNPQGATFPLKKLHTLSVVKKLICTQKLMKMIPNIKKLGITYFGDRYKEDYQLQNLEPHYRLEKLKLVLRADSSVRLEINPVFPKLLEKLTLSGWRRGWKTLEILRDVPYLQVLKLRDHACEGDTWETIDEQFPRLQHLLIDTSNVKVWETKRSHFPILKSLVLYRCSSLTAIPDDIGDIPTITLIEVDHSNKSLVECVRRISKEQGEKYNNHTLRVEVVNQEDSQSANQGL